MTKKMPEKEAMKTAEFARLHGVNIRTLHFYDDRQVFHPAYRSDAGYRMYLPEQSVTFEYIRMLQEMNLSLDSIRSCLDHPDPEKFADLMTGKIRETEKEIRQLETRLQLLKRQKQDMEAVKESRCQEVRLVNLAPASMVLYDASFAEADLEHHLGCFIRRISRSLLRLGIGSLHTPGESLDQYAGLFIEACPDLVLQEALRDPRAPQSPVQVRHLAECEGLACICLREADQADAVRELLQTAARLHRKPAGLIRARVLNLFGTRSGEELAVEFVLPLQPEIL